MQYFLCQHCRKWTEANYARSRFNVCGSECFVASFGIKDPTRRGNRTIAWLLDAGGDPDFDINEEATHQPRRLPEPSLSEPRRRTPHEASPKALVKPKPRSPSRNHLPPEKVLAIFQSPLNAAEAAAHFGVSKPAIYAIRAGTSHDEITRGLTPTFVKARRSLPAATVMAIYKDVGSHAEIGRRHDVGGHVVWSIKSGLHYAAITGHAREGR